MGLSWHQTLSSSNWSILNFGSTGYSMIYMVDPINNIFDKLINHIKLFSLFPNYVRGRHTQMSIYACIVRRLDQFSLYHIFGFLVVYLYVLYIIQFSQMLRFGPQYVNKLLCDGPNKFFIPVPPDRKLKSNKIPKLGRNSPCWP